MLQVAVLLVLFGAARTAPVDACGMIEAAIAGDDGLLDAGTCTDEAVGENGRVQVEPWVVVEGRRLRPLLPAGTMCGERYVVVMRKRLVRKLAPGLTANAIVLEFERDTGRHYYYKAYLESYARGGWSGSPGCGAERGGSVTKRHGIWGRNVYDIATGTQSGVETKVDKK